jgi:inorganic pyrophosphatase
LSTVYLLVQLSVRLQEAPFHYNSIFELPAHRMREVKRFFEDYKALEDKTVVVGDFLDRTKALESITQAIERYRQHRHTLVHANRQDGA